MGVFLKSKLSIVSLSLLLLVGAFVGVNVLLQNSSSKTVTMRPSYVADFSDNRL
jgi:hypothetical protein